MNQPSGSKQSAEDSYKQWNQSVFKMRFMFVSIWFDRRRDGWRVAHPGIPSGIVMKEYEIGKRLYFMDLCTHVKFIVKLLNSLLPLPHRPLDIFRLPWGFSSPLFSLCLCVAVFVFVELCDSDLSGTGCFFCSFLSDPGFLEISGLWAAAASCLCHRNTWQPMWRKTSAK